MHTDAPNTASASGRCQINPNFLPLPKAVIKQVRKTLLVTENVGLCLGVRWVAAAYQSQGLRTAERMLRTCLVIFSVSSPRLFKHII